MNHGSAYHFTRTATILVRANDNHDADFAAWEQEMTR